MKVSKRVLVTLVLALSGNLMAADPSLMSFNLWKDRQIVDAQNKVVRQSNRIEIQRKASKVDVGANNIEEKAQDELKAHLDRLSFTNNFSFDDYVEIYLTQFEGNDKALKKILSKFSKNELLSLVKHSIRMRRSSDPIDEARVSGLPGLNKNSKKSRESI